MHRLQTYKAHTNDINNLYLNIRIQSEQDLKKNIDDKADWTNNQTQSEMKEIQLHQDIVDDKNRQLYVLFDNCDNKRKSVFDIYFTEFGTALTTILPILFQYCYTYCYRDSRNL
jgi:hypothetical protein